jgi:protein TonB
MFGAIVGFHVLLIIALANGLGSTVMNVIVPPIEAGFIPDPPKPVEEPVIPPPRIDRIRPIEVPPPEVTITDPSASEDRLITTTITPEPPPVAPVQPARVEPIRLVGRNQLPNTEDYYPASARREGVEGAANVQVCVNERGKRESEPTITQSSGDARLDRGAVAVARDGRYARAMRGDAYVPNCYGFRVIFKVQPEK